MLQEQQFYLKHLALGHRKIANRMASVFKTSPAKVRDSLVNQGIIILLKGERIGETQKMNYFYKATGKKLVESKTIVQDESIWEDGTPKSKGNAFDLSTAKGLFTKSELAAVYNKGKPNNYNTPVQVIAYSRA